MMRIWLSTLVLMGAAHAASITTPLVHVENDRAAVSAEHLQKGMSGFVVRAFDATHSTIIANALVEETTPSGSRAILRLAPYDGLLQSSLPMGSWTPKTGDTAVLAYDYDRSLLIAPNDESYDTLIRKNGRSEWVHPDHFATYLSREGHPTPMVEDFRRYCTANSIGLLQIQAASTLFTLDCKSFTVLHTAPSETSSEKAMVPFYSRIPSIRSGWWGQGSSRLESYEPYYLEQIALNNPKNRELYELYKAKFSDKSALLRHFDLKE